MSMQAQKGEQFANSHIEPGILVLPNAWNAGSAVMMVEAGISATATTSAGIAALSLALMAGCAPQPERPSSPPVVVTKSATRPAAVSGMSGKDIQAITAYHDKVRADVGVGPIKWAPALAAYAQEWTDHLAATDCRMVHHTEGKYGENLFQGTAGHYTAVDAAKAWEAEKKDYHGGLLTQSNWHPAGHYTQMVWRDSTALGCGEAMCNKTLIVSCNYDPPGNYLGRRPY